MADTLIEIRNLSKTFHVNKKPLHAVDHVSLSIEKGCIFGVVGESGCGKTTLGQCIMNLTDATEGSILFEGSDITHLTQRQMREYRKSMQMIFQNPYSSFNPKMSIGQAFREVCGVYKIPKEDGREKINKLLDYVGLNNDVLSRHVSELSGGQLQRLAIARALIPDPQFIMADEPTSSLDVSIQAQILNLILDLKEKLHLTMMFISHELTVVEHVCDVVAVMYLGKIVEMAPTEKLFSEMMHPYSKALISAKPKDDPDREVNRIILEGDVPDAINIPTGCPFSPRCPHFKHGVCDVKKPELVEVTPGHFVACHLKNE